MLQESSSLPGHLDDEHRRSLEDVMMSYPITMVSSLRWENPAPWRIPWRHCPDTLLLFPEQGEIRAMLRSGTFSIRPGEFLILAEHTRHALELAPGCRRIRQFALHCQIHDRWSRPFASRLSSPVGRLPGRTWGMNALREITCLMGGHPKAGQERGAVFLRELLASLIAAGVRLAAQPPAGDPRIGAMLAVMEREIGNAELSVESLAGQIAITPVRFRKLFRRETGKSPRKFLVDLRLRRAAQFLQHSCASIKEVAASCGFASDHYFHHAFRKHFACTPSAYRHKILRQV